ncbi:YggT family protein [Erythrobacter crassostreae]|uniref:YggT family protein n=1 Tax=Erythrobacter crassostreae TaxID=2828328 RepID=A0A9X1F2D1_9SPHN|nr:YggT family protein [Erythrobacter crassostrea]MBV7258869.1 YggT family protein [Erythrobacter crassostrea]
MDLLVDVVGILTQAFVMLIIIQFVIGLLFAFNVVNPSNQFLMQVYQSINSLLEPILRPIRNIMPNTGAIDFSPLVLIIGLQILMAVLRSV